MWIHSNYSIGVNMSSEQFQSHYKNILYENGKIKYTNPKQFFEKDRFWCCVFAFSGHDSEQCPVCQTFKDLYSKIPKKQLPNKVFGATEKNTSAFDMQDVAYIFFAERGNTVEPYNLLCRLKDTRYAFITASTVKTNRMGFEKWYGYSYVDNDLDHMIRYGLTQEIRDKYRLLYDTSKPSHSFQKLNKKLTFA